MSYCGRQDKREILPTIVGVLLVVINISLLISDFAPDWPTVVKLSALSFFAELFIIIWVVNLASKQNRRTFAWGLFAFFFPPLALIIIGLTLPIVPKSNVLKNSENQNESNSNLDEALSEWKKQNPTKSINDFYSQKQNRPT